MRYEERGPAIHLKTKQARAARMIQQLAPRLSRRTSTCSPQPGMSGGHFRPWFHIARRLERIARAFLYLPYICAYEDRLRRHCEQLGHVRWRLWHGNLDGADWALLWLDASIDEHMWMAQVTEPETGRAPHLPHAAYLRTLLAELRWTLIADRASLTNDGAAYRRGERVATAHVESTVNQVINQRMCKKQQMRWTRFGAQDLLHARTAMINGELGCYTGVGAGERQAAEAPRFLPLPGKGMIELASASMSRTNGVSDGGSPGDRWPSVYFPNVDRGHLTHPPGRALFAGDDQLDGRVVADNVLPSTVSARIATRSVTDGSNSATANAAR